MSISYDVFSDAFLNKVTEYNFPIEFETRVHIVDGYMKRAIAEFKSVCLYDLSSSSNDEERIFEVEVKPEDIDELTNIVSEGMLVQWMKPYMYRQENLVNVLNTKDFSSYSPAELLNRIREVYDSVRRGFIAMMREYSYNHGDLTDLHL